MTKTEEGSSPSGEAEQEPTDESKVGDNDGGETAEVKEPTGDVQEDGDKVKEDAEGVPPEGQTEENPATVVEKQPEEADVTDQAAVTAAGETSEKKEGEDENPVIWDPTEFDVLSGRGASVNAHGGNKKFRAYCFSRKPEFNAGNHAAKRRIATEIVNATLANGSGRFLKRKEDKGPWFEMTKDQAILKACQVMRDYKRPDRVAMREMMAQNGNARKRQRTQESTPMLEMPMPAVPVAPLVENPFGVHEHDVLSGRGAFVNGHVGNARLRELALARKIQFDGGNYTEKRALATEIVQQIRSLDPPGRFLKRLQAAKQTKGDEDTLVVTTPGLEGSWEELNEERAIHKACQVMRDIDRPDRKDRELKRKARKEQKSLAAAGLAAAAKVDVTKADGLTVDDVEKDKSVAATKDSMTMLAETSTTAEKAAVEEAVASAVAATEAALDKALDSVAEKSGDIGTIQV